MCSWDGQGANKIQGYFPLDDSALFSPKNDGFVTAENEQCLGTAVSLTLNYY